MTELSESDRKLLAELEKLAPQRQFILELLETNSHQFLKVIILDKSLLNQQLLLFDHRTLNNKHRSRQKIQYNRTRTFLEKRMIKFGEDENSDNNIDEISKLFSKVFLT
ncbi:hypothetical protein MFLAVUS_001363 [Mucor flavus]|uniref:Uncharacterized protein n=1 Tax=Mucor flavus TaxID=439312 RepID=A0ABP9YM95_9FUNG